LTRYTKPQRCLRIIERCRLFRHGKQIAGYAGNVGDVGISRSELGAQSDLGVGVRAEKAARGTRAPGKYSKAALPSDSGKSGTSVIAAQPENSGPSISTIAASSHDPVTGDTTGTESATERLHAWPFDGASVCLYARSPLDADGIDTVPTCSAALSLVLCWPPVACTPGPWSPPNAATPAAVPRPAAFTPEPPPSPPQATERRPVHINLQATAVQQKR
jgi:hypothetical protein